MKLVTVIVPVYNAQKFLTETIESVINQTYQNWELLLIDDGSKDESIKIITDYTKKDNRIKLLFHEGNKNGGVSKTRNLGIINSQGEYIALLDSDDIWLNNKLEKQINILDKYPEVGIVYSQLKTKFDVPNKNFPAICGSGKEGINENAFELMVYDNLWMPNSSVVFKKEVLDHVYKFNENLKYQVEDHLFFTKVAYYYKCYYIEEVLGLYRMHNASYTYNTKWQYSLYEFLFQLFMDKKIRSKKLIITAFLKRLIIKNFK